MLDYNDHYNCIMLRLNEIETEECTDRNRLINIDNLQQASREQLCKPCVIEKIDNERETIIDVIVDHLIQKKR